ncbi:hypothetical protein C3K47_10950 [Solitalea longa]|uniref:Uncharacterized protein n=1 Tax=Solitalea longa TaxID=2079460 RepID=A0A2S5A134_9SPHI|nr:hypothetical protein [Solitalea longa]POY36265.1 hypothetical protein C3K47_10950 [Solitalea longa]
MERFVMPLSLERLVLADEIKEVAYKASRYHDPEKRIKLNTLRQRFNYNSKQLQLLDGGETEERVRELIRYLDILLLKLDFRINGYHIDLSQSTVIDHMLHSFIYKDLICIFYRGSRGINRDYPYLSKKYDINPLIRLIRAFRLTLDSICTFRFLEIEKSIQDFKHDLNHLANSQLKLNTFL